jgi:hypothetical protein
MREAPRPRTDTREAICCDFQTSVPEGEQRPAGERSGTPPKPPPPSGLMIGAPPGVSGCPLCRRGGRSLRCYRRFPRFVRQTTQTSRSNVGRAVCTFAAAISPAHVDGDCWQL